MKDEGSRMKEAGHKSAQRASFILHPSSFILFSQAWARSTFGLAAVGGVLLWAALPPLGLWPLAWIAPIWWVLLVRRKELPPLATDPPRRRRPFVLLIAWGLWFAGCMTAVWVWNDWGYAGFWAVELVLWPAAFCLCLASARWWRRRPYCTLWLVGFAFWLAALHWLRLPHWATCFGWLALSFYFAFYFPLFVGLSRVAVHRLGVPVIVAAPVVWTGLELARAHVLTGMTMASLGHTQYRWIELIQISDLAGAFGVSFLVMFVAACLGRMVPCDGRRWAAWPLAPALAVLAAALVYGHVRILPADEKAPPDGRIALIQGSIDTRMKCDPAMQKKIFEHYLRWSQAAVREAAKKHEKIDLIVWPETMLPWPWTTYDANCGQPEQCAELPPAKFRKQLKQAAQDSLQGMSDTARLFDTAMILGVAREHFGPSRVQNFNSAAFLSRDGKLAGHYDKMHPVMFGEYVPLADRFPWLQRLTPLGDNLSEGQGPAAFTLGKLRIAPNICYETVLSHVLRDQINKLQDRGEEPNVLVNLTNDGWFWGSSELDMHLACAVFRAVECRKPLLIAANTGFSAWIDGDGRLKQQGPRRDADTLLAEVRFDPRSSWYRTHGDWPAGLCLAACIALGLLGPCACRRDRFQATGPRNREAAP